MQYTVLLKTPDRHIMTVIPDTPQERIEAIRKVAELHVEMMIDHVLADIFSCAVIMFAYRRMPTERQKYFARLKFSVMKAVVLTQL